MYIFVNLSLIRSPGRDIDCFPFLFCIWWPQVAISFPQVSMWWPQVGIVWPQVGMFTNTQKMVCCKWLQLAIVCLNKQQKLLKVCYTTAFHSFFKKFISLTHKKHIASDQVLSLIAIDMWNHPVSGIHKWQSNQFSKIIRLLSQCMWMYCVVLYCIAGRMSHPCEHAISKWIVLEATQWHFVPVTR